MNCSPKQQDTEKGNPSSSSWRQSQEAALHHHVQARRQQWKQGDARSHKVPKNRRGKGVTATACKHMKEYLKTHEN